MFSISDLRSAIQPFEAAIRAGENPAPLIDWLIEHDHADAAEAIRSRLFKVAGRGKARGPVLIDPGAEDFVRAVWQDRHDRATHPDGTFDSGGRWYPSDAESCGGSGRDARGPSRAYPYSYLLRCRSREHVRALVAAALSGADVPADVICTAGEWRVWVIRHAIAAVPALATC